MNLDEIFHKLKSIPWITVKKTHSGSLFVMDQRNKVSGFLSIINEQGQLKFYNETYDTVDYYDDIQQLLHEFNRTWKADLLSEISQALKKGLKGLEEEAERLYNLSTKYADKVSLKLFCILHIVVEEMSKYSNIVVTNNGIALSNKHEKVEISCNDSDEYEFSVEKYIGKGKKLVKTIIVKNYEDVIRYLSGSWIRKWILKPFKVSEKIENVRIPAEFARKYAFVKSQRDPPLVKELLSRMEKEYDEYSVRVWGSTVDYIATKIPYKDIVSIVANKEEFAKYELIEKFIEPPLRKEELSLIEEVEKEQEGKKPKDVREELRRRLREKLSDAQIEEECRKINNEMGGLLDETAQLSMLASKLGIDVSDLFHDLVPEKLTIDRLKQLPAGVVVDVEGRVTNVEPTLEFEGGRRLKKIAVDDGTDVITVNLWNYDEEIREGEEVAIKSLIIKRYKGEIELNSTSMTKILRKKSSKVERKIPREFARVLASYRVNGFKDDEFMQNLKRWTEEAFGVNDEVEKWISRLEEFVAKNKLDWKFVNAYLNAPRSRINEFVKWASEMFVMSSEDVKRAIEEFEAIVSLED